MDLSRRSISVIGECLRVFSLGAQPEWLRCSRRNHIGVVGEIELQHSIHLLLR